MVKIRPEEVADVIKAELEKFETQLNIQDTGIVIAVGDGIARVYGLRNVMASELVEFEGGIYGMALNLEEDNVGCIILGDDKNIREGSTAKVTGKIVEVPVGEGLLGRIVNPLGHPIDGKGPIAYNKTRPVEQKAWGVVYRQPVKE
ncbi:MAG: F0F1 ATP synthase subunit alpha, partial [Planctomycetota bacterium]